MSSTNDVRVDPGEEREGFKEGAKERELIVLLKQTGRAFEQKDQRQG